MEIEEDAPVELVAHSIRTARSRMASQVVPTLKQQRTAEGLVDRTLRPPLNYATLFVIADTNVFIGHLRYLMQLKTCKFHGPQGHVLGVSFLC